MKTHVLTILASCAFASIAAVYAEAYAEDSPSPTATITLNEMLRLHRMAEDSAVKKKSPPPLAAAINRVRLNGRVLDEAVEAEATFEVTVLPGGGWVTLPLLHKDALINISAIPTLEGAVLAVVGSELALITDQPGAYNFSVSLTAGSIANGRGKRAEINVGDATVAMMRVHVDENLFRVRTPRAVLERDGIVIVPEGHRFRVDWEQISAIKKPSVETRRQPIEPMITSAHVSTVSTLGGKQLTRALYELRFDGTKEITFQIPAGHGLDRVYLNGLAVPFQVDGSKLTLDVEPSRAGDQGGTVELVLVKEQEIYFLSGRMNFELPAASWMINELSLDLHLPEVFVYTWTGGSLAPIETPTAATFAHQMPTPGKQLSFRQFLVAAATSHAKIDYAVNIEGKYFR